MIWRLIEAGGPVMWPLLALSLACGAIVFERTWTFWRAPSPREFVGALANATHLEGAAQELGLRLEKNLPLLASTATLAPLLGLLGTVTGMITTFNALAGARPGGSNDAVLAGIGEALYATAAGIAVALGALVFHGVFAARARRLIAEIEAAASERFDHEPPIRAPSRDEAALNGVEASGQTVEVRR